MELLHKIVPSATQLPIQHGAMERHTYVWIHKQRTNWNAVFHNMKISYSFIQCSIMVRTGIFKHEYFMCNIIAEQECPDGVGERESKKSMIY